MALRQEVEAIIEERIAPLLRADESGIELVEVDDAQSEVVVRITGALRACPGITFVKTDVIERTLGARGVRVRYA